MPASDTIDLILSNLATQTGFDWQYGGPYPIDISKRHGLLVTPYFGVPGGIEQWQYGVEVHFKTQLQATSSDNLAVLGLDFCLGFNARLVKSCEPLRLKVEAINGDRHGGLSFTHRGNADYIKGEIVIIDTIHIYKLYYHGPLITL